MLDVRVLVQGRERLEREAQISDTAAQQLQHNGAGVVGYGVVAGHVVEDVPLLVEMDEDATVRPRQPIELEHRAAREFYHRWAPAPAVREHQAVTCHPSTSVPAGKGENGRWSLLYIWHFVIRRYYSGELYPLPRLDTVDSCRACPSK